MTAARSIYRLIRGGPTPRWSYSRLTNTDGQVIDDGSFVEGRRSTVAGLESELRSRGVVVDFDLMTAGIPIVRDVAAEWMETLGSGQIQFIPLAVAGLDERLTVANVLSVQDLLSDESRALRLPADEARKADRGRITALIEPILTRRPPERCHLFRVARAEMDLFCDEQFRSGFLRAALVGVTFHPVRVLAAR